MRIVFFGTPDFAVPSFEKLIDCGYDVVAAVCQPDRPSGRKGEITPCAVKRSAIARGVKVLQYGKVSREGASDLKSLSPDLFVTAAFGQILSKEILDIPKYGTLNVHGSLLPKYRGAAPIQAAIINGEKYTGITIMRTNEGLDTGDILLQKTVEIGANETAGELFERMSVVGADALIEAVALVSSGRAHYTPQNEAESSYFSTLKKTDGCIDFSRSATEINNLIRGTNPWPCAYTAYCGKTLKVFSAEVVVDQGIFGEFGEVVEANKDGFTIACGAGKLKFKTIQLENCNKMAVSEFLRGRKVEVGMRFPMNLNGAND